jgi:hypothetical protein
MTDAKPTMSAMEKPTVNIILPTLSSTVPSHVLNVIVPIIRRAVNTTPKIILNTMAVEQLYHLKLVVLLYM